MLPAPPWVTKSLTFWWAKRDGCGSQELIITFAGASFISFSHFQTTLCFSFEKAFNSNSLFSSGIFEALITDPNETNTTPCSASYSNENEGLWNWKTNNLSKVCIKLASTHFRRSPFRLAGGWHVMRPPRIVWGWTGLNPSPVKTVPWLIWRATFRIKTFKSGTSSSGNSSWMKLWTLGSAHQSLNIFQFQFS